MKIAVLPIAILLAFGCSPTPTDPSASLEPTEALFARGPALHWASGHGHFPHPIGEVLGAKRNFSFTAREHADGTVSGQARLNIMTVGWDSENPAITQYFQAEVVCMSVDGNRARIGAEIRTSSVPGNDPGDGVGWTVVDNGEGKSAPPDLITVTQLPTVTAPGFAQDYCAGLVQPNPVLYEVVGGNIQVR